MHIEIFTKNTLVLAQKFCKSKNRREHVTPYIYNNKKFKIKNFSSVKDLSYHRWTIDYKEDYLFAKKYTIIFTIIKNILICMIF